MPIDVEALLNGAVDLYVHAEPDLLPRRGGDLALATECRDAGYRAALHRHHFSTTVERSAVAADATGFALFGAVLLNDSVGGINPWAVELALRLGGRWIGLPTLSAKAFRDGLDHIPPAARTNLDFGPGRITLIDDGGTIHPEVHAVLELARAAGVPVNVGYPSMAEVRALLHHARDLGQVPIVLTNPHTSLRTSVDAVVQLADTDIAHIELTAYSMHPDGPSKRDPGPPLDRAVEIIRRVGIDRCVLSSDGGMRDAPSPPTMLGFALRELHARGLAHNELAALVQTNPSRLLCMQ